MIRLRSVVGVAAVLVLAAGAAAGPDVVTSTVGEGGPNGIEKHATLNGITGYSVTTTACNIGNTTAAWIYFNNLHPLIGSQMYRLHNGRFEQIGMSWLKHSFCAADEQPGCVNLVPGAVYAGDSFCDTLGPFATDTYNSFLNGQQSNLGPRSEVNASTGSFPFPPSMGWGNSNNFSCLTKRLQLANSDLNPANYPGARYFMEVTYITPDLRASSLYVNEAPAQRTNNSSFREVLVGALSDGQTGENMCSSSTQGYSLAFVGGTVPLLPALEAWRSVDPAVTIVYNDIANDGRVGVAARVTDLGGSLWQYEYAVYNMNSDKSIGSFAIPKATGPGVNITNLGFHDVAYHSGEPYDGTNWVGAVNANNITWATTPWSTNANANAIRWSTTFNFRFQANRAPVNGTVTLGLFKGASPGSVTLGGLPVPSGAASCPADFNHVGGVTLQDLFDFLNAWFNADAAADFNHADGVTVQDVFDYLGAWFAPCP